MTDYSAAGFARRYGLARPIAAGQVHFWATALAAAVPPAEVVDVLDAGAGVGRFWPVLRAAWQPARIVAMDRSAAMLQHGLRIAEVRLLVGDITAVPLAAESVDLVFCSMSVHHCEDPAVAVSELMRALRPGGSFCIRSGTVDTLKSFEFLCFFPSALTAEMRVMPTLAQLTGWLAHPNLDLIQVATMTPSGATPRLRAWRAVARRGFPSLQLVPRQEFVIGTVKYALWLLWKCARGFERRGEESVLLVARRTS